MTTQKSFPHFRSLPSLAYRFDLISSAAPRNLGETISNSNQFASSNTRVCGSSTTWPLMNVSILFRCVCMWLIYSVIRLCGEEIFSTMMRFPILFLRAICVVWHWFYLTMNCREVHIIDAVERSSKFDGRMIEQFSVWGFHVSFLHHFERSPSVKSGSLLFVLPPGHRISAPGNSSLKTQTFVTVPNLNSNCRAPFTHTIFADLH